jgi:ribonucleoside-diphosphate reductase beta chain
MLEPHEKPSAARIDEIIRSCVEVERRFVKEALPVSLIGMNSELIEAYVEFVADSLCVGLGIAKLFNSKNPFVWMENISLQGKTNFFEARVTEYAKAGVGDDMSGKEFSLNEDF